LPPPGSDQTATNTVKLSKLRETIKQKRPGRLTAGVRHLHDGARPHTAAWLQKQKWEVLQHPPHDPDVVPSDFYLFRPFKNFFGGQIFEEQNSLQKPVVHYFTALGKEEP
jgi:hypothetical protein